MPTFKVLGRHLDKTWRRYRPFLSPKFRDAYASLINHQQPIPEHGKKVLFNLGSTRVDGPQGRRFYNLHTYFTRAGYHPVFVNHYGFLANPKNNFKAACFEQPFSLIEAEERLPGDPHDWVIINEQSLPSVAVAMANAPSFTLSLNVNEWLAPNEFPWPFPLFPGVYQRGQDLQLEELRRQPRLWDCFFGGQSAANKYDTDWVRTVYGRVTRKRYLEIAKETVQSHPAAIVEPNSGEQLSHWEHQAVKGAVFIRNECCKIQVEQWLATLARARFFFACPGVRYPMSHNAVEALAVGTVPIIEYGDDFYPALEDGVNCLGFNGEEGLRQAIERALAMPIDEWETLSKNAIRYYEDYAKPEAVIHNLLEAQRQDGVDTIKLVPFLKRGGGHI
ncbi:hypothetical protein BGP77_03245 [Saccharospirillum sp. MSK14-1]|uniref:glycosyltransferase n=1 Tax=Saccharospirillum sp. MSK14-1 TaxID=1897632 RepID=UPI000D361964|nr:glycosyltransferase [Saccharospirillum sp. MSK14-1]PTY36336.1 hypothetical protein BGP77_03245 [Saccharospirillum sp. MSK14-1]